MHHRTHTRGGAARRRGRGDGRRATLGAIALACGASLVALGARPAGQGGAPAADGQGSGDAGASLETTRLVMGKWIETQRILSKERNEWQQGQEILAGRLDLVKREIAGLKEKIAEAQASVAANDAVRAEILAEQAELDATNAELTGTVTGLEADVVRLHGALPEPVKQKLALLRQRIPEDPATTEVTAPERFQNVLGILSELNKANNEIAVTYEVRKLADGRPAEVRVIYVGLAQAYYVSAGGEGGIGRPTLEGWTWEASSQVSGDVLQALEIVQGKHSPAFVPLPLRIQ